MERLQAGNNYANLHLFKSKLISRNKKKTDIPNAGTTDNDIWRGNMNPNING
jgi:hypothetical protein